MMYCSPVELCALALSALGAFLPWATADAAFAGFDSIVGRLDNLLPDLDKGKDGELYKKVKTIRELADSFNKRSAVFMEEGRRSLLDISEAAVKVTRKFDGPGPRR